MLAVNQRAAVRGPMVAHEGDARVQHPWRKGCVVVGGKMQEVDVLPPQDLGVVTSFATEVDHGIDGVIAAQSLEVEVCQPSADGQTRRDPRHVHRDCDPMDG